MRPISSFRKEPYWGLPAGAIDAEAVGIDMTSTANERSVFMRSLGEEISRWDHLVCGKGTAASAQQRKLLKLDCTEGSDWPSTSTAENVGSFTENSRKESYTRSSLSTGNTTSRRVSLLSTFKKVFTGGLWTLECLLML